MEDPAELLPVNGTLGDGLGVDGRTTRLEIDRFAPPNERPSPRKVFIGVTARNQHATQSLNSLRTKSKRETRQKLPNMLSMGKCYFLLGTKRLG